MYVNMYTSIFKSICFSIYSTYSIYTIYNIFCFSMQVHFFWFQLRYVTPIIKCIFESREAGPSIIYRSYLSGHLLSHVNCALLWCSSRCIRAILVPSTCIANVEVIIIAMACHIGLYLELTFNEGSQRRRGSSGLFKDQRKRLPRLLSTSFSSVGQ